MFLRLGSAGWNVVVKEFCPYGLCLPKKHPFLYEKSGAPGKIFFWRWIFFLLNAIYDLEDLRDRH